MLKMENSLTDKECLWRPHQYTWHSQGKNRRTQRQVKRDYPDWNANRTEMGKKKKKTNNKLKEQVMQKLWDSIIYA